MDDERFAVDLDTTRLTIRHTQLTDDGNYACSVKTTGYPPIVSNSAHLYVYSLYFCRASIKGCLKVTMGGLKTQEWKTKDDQKSGDGKQMSGKRWRRMQG